MSKIDDLIQRLCPDGVEYKQLCELLDYEQPTKYLVQSTHYDGSFPIPVLTAGQTFILGYTDEITGIYDASKHHPVIIFDDFTTAFKWVDFPFKAKSSAMKMLSPLGQVSLRYLWFAMQTIEYKPQDHARQWIGTYSKIRVPVPPLPVQEEIVRILDSFTSLEAELEARRRQYEHYLHAAVLPDGDLEWTTLGDATTNHDRRRKPVTRSDRKEGEFPYYGANGIQDYVHDFIFDGTFLLVGEDGSVKNADGTPVLNWASGKIWVNNHAHVLTASSEQFSLRYLYYYLATVDVTAYVTGGTQPKINQKNLNSIPVPVIARDFQDRVVEILDRFDALVNDLSVGLPAELAARRKQYEFYRDRLLSFKELAA